MVLVVMVRTIQRIRFTYEIRNLSQRLWTKVGILGNVGRHVHVVLGRNFRSQSKFLKVLAREDWRIFQLLNVGDGKVRGATPSRNRICAAADGSKRCADAPTRRDNHGRLYWNVAHR